MVHGRCREIFWPSDSRHTQVLGNPTQEPPVMGRCFSFGEVLLYQLSGGHATIFATFFRGRQVAPSGAA
jgi:hypothetical protein